VTAIDFASLRREGLARVRRLAGGTWTDHNVHDPGITILEQVCYALSDLGYRTGYDMRDLLARDGEDPYASLFGPDRILPTSPVTISDLRKVAIDVAGVRNAWVELVDEPAAAFDAAQGEVSYADDKTSGSAPNPNVTAIHVKGLYRVSVERSELEDVDSATVVTEVTRRLHRCRGLCTDYRQIVVLENQPIGLDVTLEIGTVEDVTALLADVYQALAGYFSPAVRFHTLEEMLARGYRMDQIFDGPLLDHGFIDASELARMNRRDSVRISDLIHALMAVPGVAAVKSLHFLAHDGTPAADWLLLVDAGKTPRFDLEKSRIRLEKRGLRVDTGLASAAQKRFDKQALEASQPRGSAALGRDLRPTPGRDRRIARYQPVQQHFPMVYGIGRAGLPQSAPPQRRAQALQLKAYIMFFDQLLANHYAQLANLEKLFSFHDETTDSYFSQPVPDDGTLALDEVRAKRADEHAAALQRITEQPLDLAPPAAPDEASRLRRRNRFLDHLLARFGEQFRDYSLLQGGLHAEPAARDAQLARDKRAFLRDYPAIGLNRGTAFDCLERTDGPVDNISGLELTLRRKLGIVAPDERFYLVEHVLLRPVPGDANQHGPLLRAARVRDPYSLQITFVFPQAPVRYADPDFKAFVERTVNEETPAHIAVTIAWKDDAAMQAFRDAYERWTVELRAARLRELGIEP
jgi:hypothetical protein